MPEHTTEYQINNEGWQTYDSTITLDRNAVVSVRIKNSTGQVVSTQTINVTNIDKVEPNEFELSTVRYNKQHKK